MSVVASDTDLSKSVNHSKVRGGFSHKLYSFKRHLLICQVIRLKQISSLTTVTWHKVGPLSIFFQDIF